MEHYNHGNVMDHIDPNDLKYSTDDFRVDTHPNQGVIIENGPQKKNDVTTLKNGKPFIIFFIFLYYSEAILVDLWPNG